MQKSMSAKALRRTRRTAARNTVGRCSRRWLGLLAVLLGGSMLLGGQTSPAQPPAADAPEERPAAKPAGKTPQARLVTLPLPIAGNSDVRLMNQITRTVDEMNVGTEPRPVLVLEFSTGQSEFGLGNDFTRVLSLARFLSSPQLAGVKTVAYLPGPIRGHAVLAAMACEEIVMAPGASLGDAGADERADALIDPTVRAGYNQIASRRRTIPPELALGLLDKDLEVLKVETEVSTEYVLRDGLEELRETRTIQGEPEVVIARGERGVFSGREARELGIARYLAEDRAALARALGVSAESLHESPLLDGEWRPFWVRLDRTIDHKVVTTRQRWIQNAIRNDDANFILVSVDSEGGSPESAAQFATFLASLDRSKVLTVAFIDNQASGVASIIANACDQVVMRPQAQLGGDGLDDLSLDQMDELAYTFKEAIAKQKGVDWSIPVAMFTPDLAVFEYTHLGTGATAYFSEAELRAQPQPDQWRQGRELTRRGEALQLTGVEAEQVGVARRLVANFGELKNVYGLEDSPALIEPGFVEQLIEGLASDRVAWALLLIGGMALYIEVQMPGIGIGGFVAAVCFVLFFWAKNLDGTADTLEIVLFLVGATFILLEIFVLPGFGIFGLGGGLLLIISLVLASQTTALPTSAAEIRELRNSLLVVGGPVVGLVIFGFVARRWLPHTPLFSHVMLAPPQDDELHSLEERESLGHFQHLLHEVGAAVTRLGPSGKARFGEEIVDVVADSEIISAGAAVQVIEVRGTRIVVRSADSA